MKLHSIATPIGAATLAEITTPIHGIQGPEDWGLIFWGRCDRATFGQILLSSQAKWIADYDVRAKVAIVIWPEELAGKILEIDTACVDAICPHCGASDYRSDGPSRWLCKSCDRTWAKNPKPRGGAGRGQGRKSKGGE
jgi:hypothetical protein